MHTQDVVNSSQEQHYAIVPIGSWSSPAPTLARCSMRCGWKSSPRASASKVSSRRSSFGAWTAIWKSSSALGASAPHCGGLAGSARAHR